MILSWCAKNYIEKVGEGDTRDVQFEKTIFDTQSKEKEIIFSLYLSEIRRILFVKMTTTNYAE